MNALAHAPSTRFRHKLRNSLLALSAVAAVSGAGLLVAEPAPQAVIANAIEAAPADGSPPRHQAAAGAKADAGEAADLTERRASSGQPRHSRHSVAIPFFSFSARS